MNLTETAALLAYIGELDGRTITDATVEAWNDVLKDISLPDAKQAVVTHFHTSPGEWLTIDRILHHVKTIRKQRLSTIGTITPNSTDCATTAAELEARRRLTQLIADGRLTPNDYRTYQESGQPLTDWMAQKQLGAA